MIEGAIRYIEIATIPKDPRIGFEEPYTLIPASYKKFIEI